MQKAIYFIVFLLLSGNVLAEQKRLFVMPFHVVNDSINTNLTKHEAEFKFRIRNQEFRNPPFEIILRTAVNGVWKEITVDSVGSFSYKVEPGEYQFQFYVNENFIEISSQKVKIGAQHEITVALNFINNSYYQNQPVEIDKPIIYFHTSEQRVFEIGVTPTEAFTFVYPEMNGTWKGIAEENGTVTIDGKSYPYLFWESQQQYVFASEGNGFKVEKNDIILFLTRKLTELGLNEQEQTDFITYWGPKLAANETSFVQFSVDESCDAFAKVDCVPTPDFMRRVYIQVAQWNPGFEHYLKDVTFDSFQKTGWYVIEWGGFEFKTTAL